MSYVQSTVHKMVMNMLYDNIMKRDEYPKVGRPTMKCSECAFYKEQCIPQPDVVGCFKGWTLMKSKVIKC